MSKKNKNILFAILALAAILRLWILPATDVITDEGLNGFRSIGYIDFFVSEYQTTPYDWLGAQELPGWVKLSFHDHPPLAFIASNVFFKIGGINRWALRLPFALAGIASVYLVYLITRQLFKKYENDGSPTKPGMTTGEAIGLTSAFLLAINSYHVWVSRIGLQESIVIMLILLTVYLFLKSLDNKKYLLWTGLAFGLAMLSKYTSIILVPILLIYLAIYKRKYFKDKALYLGGILSLIVFSPVLLYNLKLFQQFGHFDFQLSYFLGQTVEAWSFRLGRLQAGSFNDRLIDLLPAIARGITPVLPVLAIAAVIYAAYKIFKKSDRRRSLLFILLAIVFYLILFLGIGPRERFVAMIVPFVIMLVAWLLVSLIGSVILSRAKMRLAYSLILMLLTLFVGYEIFFSVNTSLNPDSLSGQEGIAYSRLKIESLNWGYNELDDYLSKELYQDYYPAFTFPTRFKFMEDIKQESLAKAKASGKEAKSILLIYDENMHSSATIWYIFRPFVYQGWPFVSAEAYSQVVASEGEGFFRQQGVAEFLLIKASENTLLRPAEERQTSAADLASKLDTEPVVITNSRIGEAFEIYYFN